MNGDESATSLKNMGNLAMGRGDLELAKTLYLKAIQADPAYMPAYYNLGNVFRRQGNDAHALRAYEQAAVLAPDDYEIHVNIGVTYQRMMQPEQAIKAFQNAVELAPRALEPAFNLAFATGVLRNRQQRHAEAADAFRHSLRFKPDHLDSLTNLGFLLAAMHHNAEAEAVFRRTLDFHPTHAETFNNLGNLLNEQGRDAEAEAAYRQAITLWPDYLEAHANLGVLLKRQLRFDEAEATYRRALVITPDEAHIHNNLGNLLVDRLRYDEAEAAYRQALRLQPDHVEAWYNLGSLMQTLGRYAKAEEAFQQTLNLKPDHLDCRMNLGLLLLSLGRLTEGWPLYEARHQIHGQRENPVGKEILQWRGEPLTGKSLLILPEQGFGDKIQFCRFVAQLKAMGAATITLVCTPPLEALFRSLAGVDRLMATDAGVTFDRHDYWTFILSIPLCLGTTLETLPATLPYLAPPRERLELPTPHLPPQGFKVGLVWKGRPTHHNDGNRSLPGLAVLAPLWSVLGVSFFSLQKGAGEEEAMVPPQGQPLLHLGALMGDFADSAAVVARLDLVIAVDTAVVHLAGSLGKPCWVLLPALGLDWRWLHGRDDSPWYPGVMRLFRQATPGDWSAVIAEVAAALANTMHQRTLVV
ncbi:MAG: tetratricopeptide repeat protein [Magnetococcales bacterium]|nr:tetratricopeptide repeat protein [Magnetococcales bacterium]